MRLIVKLIVLVASLLAFVVILGIGVIAVGVEESGERLSGALLAIAALIAFGAAMFLALRPAAYFRTPARKSLAAGATLAALAPVVALGFAAFQFAGLPFGTTDPLLDWSAFVLGVIFVIGALGIIALGYRRVTERPVPFSSAQDAPMAVPFATPPPLRASAPQDDDIRVSRV